MHLRAGSHMSRPGRLPALLQAVLLALTLVLAPELHRHTCNGVCASAPGASGPRVAGPAADGVAEEPGASSCCHGAANQAESPAPQGSGERHGSSSGGCDCLDDCCSIYANGTTPEVATDTGPATLLVSAAPDAPPAQAPRAAGARLLPYPNGPPPVA